MSGPESGRIERECVDGGFSRIKARIMIPAGQPMRGIRDNQGRRDLSSGMRFLVISDLHLEFAAYRPDACMPDFDAVILAGDIMANGAKVPGWAAEPSQFGRDKPIVVVAGNHEFYGGVMQGQQERMQKARVPNVHVLDPGEVRFDQGRVRILGCTLWTDFQLPVLTPDGPVSDPRRAADHASRCLTDFRVIDFHEPGFGPRRLTPADTVGLHRAQRDWLLAKLRQPFAGATVVVTHHGPSAGSVARQWADDWLTPAFISDLPETFFEVPALWVHGHTHTSLDYRRGRTRVVCNPRGYGGRDGSFENPHFDPRLVIDTDGL
jgi:Icc-related predicted phosphoesterase